MTDRTAALETLYARLLAHFGPQQWWPAATPFEVMVGAVLTQNTSWTNVEKAMANLRAAQLLTPHALLACSPDALAQAILPAGTYRIKAQRLRTLVMWLMARCGGDIGALHAIAAATLREELLALRGIGPETADAIVLYAIGHPTFVIDAYTHRVLSRHHLADMESDYETLQSLFHKHLTPDIAQWNEFHALFVAVGKTYCRRRAPCCEQCPLNGFLWNDRKPLFD